MRGIRSVDLVVVGCVGLVMGVLWVLLFCLGFVVVVVVVVVSGSDYVVLMDNVEIRDVTRWSSFEERFGFDLFVGDSVGRWLW